MILRTYLSQDRLRALARGDTLPDRTHGSALFADISGFTPLTERLTRELGQRRGIEELTRQINAVYDALIAEIERYGGSVIDFAGDAVTCWFDGDTGAYGAACALALQNAMLAFPALALKVALTNGPARRFAVGSADIHLLDALAGATIARLATGEHLAARGEVLMDSTCALALSASAHISAWRTAETERFAVLSAFTLPTALQPATPIPQLSAEQLRPWIQPAVFAREQSGHGAFLTELRPAIALFIRFDGIAYDEDDQAGEKLSTLIARAQTMLAQHEGTLLQLTIGDKGSYLYAAFGVPMAHEDDARRAVLAALELQASVRDLPFLLPLQIGISRGIMRVGAYGGSTRRVYGSLGDEVNLAARLMTGAAPGEIVISGHMQEQVAHSVICEARAPIKLKGKAEPVTTFSVTGVRRQRAARLEEQLYALPMMGRHSELAQIDEKLEVTLQGRGQIIGIVAEAGLGKSRLVAEAIRIARRKGFICYGGACQSSGTNTPYLVWRPIWQAFFAIDPSAPAGPQLHHLESKIAKYAAQHVPGIPVLSGLLDLTLADNDFTRALEPKDRRNLLTAIAEACLKAASVEGPHLIVLEDMHWLDALSHDLLETLARISARLPVCFVLAYRPPESVRLQASRVESLAHFTRIALDRLTPSDSANLMRAKLAQLFPDYTSALPQALADKFHERAAGNPFYIEELLNYLHDRRIVPFEADALQSFELPNSLHALLLSRIDRLSETQKATLKSASVIGRSFRVTWLHDYYPALGTFARIQADLEELSVLDLTPLETPEPELVYLFKHIITHEVAYESMPYAMRAQLHEQLAHYIEGLKDGHYLDLLAFHYSLSANTDKQREFFQKAGDAAQAAYANDAALEYYTRLLSLLAEPHQQVGILLKLGAVHERIGQWAEAEGRYRDTLALTQDDLPATAHCQHALGALFELRGDYDAALMWLQQAQMAWEALGDQTALGHTLTEIGRVYWYQGEYAQARSYTEQGVALARNAHDQTGMALALNALGNVATAQGDYATAQTLYEESLTLKQALGDKRGISMSFNNLGVVAMSQDDYAAARALHEKSLALRREIGDKYGIALSFNNLGNVAWHQGDYTAARALHEESLALKREMGDKQGIAASLNNLGLVAKDQGDYTAARALHEESLALRREMGDKQGIAKSLNNLGEVALGQAQYATAQALFAESLAFRQEMGDKQGIASAQSNLGFVAVKQHDYALARSLHAQSLALAHAVGDKRLVVYNLIGLAAVALGMGEVVHAVRLASAAETLLTTTEGSIGRFVRELYDAIFATAHTTLSAAAFDAAWTEGAGMTPEEALKEMPGQHG